MRSSTCSAARATRASKADALAVQGPAVDVLDDRRPAPATAGAGHIDNSWLGSSFIVRVHSCPSHLRWVILARMADAFPVPEEDFLRATAVLLAEEGARSEVRILASTPAEFILCDYDRWDGGQYGWRVEFELP